MLTFIYSLYRTYQDIKNYKSSLVYQKKEFEVLQDDPNEAYTILIQIAEISRLAGAPQEEVEKVYEQVREEVCTDQVIAIGCIHLCNSLFQAMEVLPSV